MDVTQRARLAIQRGEAWKADTMADLDEVAHAAELAHMAAIDPTLGMVARGHADSGAR